LDKIEEIIRKFKEDIIFSAGHSGVDFAGRKKPLKMVLNMSLTFLMQ